MLNATLADTTDLMTQAKVAHWNVKGMNFYQLHLLFDEIAETLNEHVDIIAERTTALGGEATGTVRDAAASTHIPELPPDATTGPEYVEALVERVGVHANSLRRDIEIAVEHGDEDTADMYTELSREVDKQLYFLEAHLQAVEPEAVPRSPGVPTQSQQSTRNQRSMQGQQSAPGQQPTQSRQPTQSQQSMRGQQSTHGRMQGGSPTQGGRRSRYGGGQGY